MGPISSRLVGNQAPRARRPGHLCSPLFCCHHASPICSILLVPAYGTRIVSTTIWVNTVPLTFARCVGGTPWCWVCWSPLLWRRWPMPAMMPGRAIPTTTASQSPEQTTSCVPACTFSRNPTVSVRDTASRPLPVAMLPEPPRQILMATSTTVCAGACRCIQIPTTSVQNAASRSTPATMGPTKVARNA